MGSEVSRCGLVAEEYPYLTDGVKDVAYYPRGGSESGGVSGSWPGAKQRAATVANRKWRDT